MNYKQKFTTFLLKTISSYMTEFAIKIIHKKIKK